MLRTINKTSLVHALKLRSLLSAELLRQGISVRLLFNAKYAFALHKSQKPAFFVCMFFLCKEQCRCRDDCFLLTFELLILCSTYKSADSRARKHTDTQRMKRMYSKLFKGTLNFKNICCWNTFN